MFEDGSCTRATKATPSRLIAEQGRYPAAAGAPRRQRLAPRGAVRHSGMDCSRAPAGCALSN